MARSVVCDQECGLWPGVWFVIRGVACGQGL